MSNLLGYQSSTLRIIIIFLIFLPLVACQTGSEVSFPGTSSNNNLISPDTNEAINSGENVVGSVDPAVPVTDPVIEPTPVTDPDPINVVPTASDDSVTTEMGLSVNVNVLSNDSGLSDGLVQISVFSDSANGTTVVEADNTITYTPNPGYNGSDSFSYQIKDKDNDIATATVSIGITCSTCPAPTILSLAWKQNAGQVDGYRVYFGSAIDTTDTPVMDTVATIAQFDTRSDLSLQTGDTACFRIKSYNNLGESGYSKAMCFTI